VRRDGRKIIDVSAARAAVQQRLGGTEMRDAA
jgi:hypothetical protein